jgi:hypothetical protein
MPKWAAQWHLCSLGELLNGYVDDWDEFIGYKHIWHLQCRLDHEGVIESEDPLIFQVCAREVMLKLLSHKAYVIRSISEKGQSADPATIYQNLIEGIVQMLGLAGKDGCAFWTSGGEDDLDHLNQWMIRCQPAGSPSGADMPPHERDRQNELIGRAKSQLKTLRNLAQSGVLTKSERVLVSQIEPRMHRAEITQDKS